MADFEINDIKYKSRKMSARDQWNVTRRLLPVMTGLRHIAQAWADASESQREAEKEDASDEVKAKALREHQKYLASRDNMLQELATAVSKLSDEDSDFILNTCLSLVQRNDPARPGWFAIWNSAAKKEMFDDITMPVMLAVVGNVLQIELMGFFK